MKVEILNGYTGQWVDITGWIAWQGLTFSRNDIDNSKAGRDMAGTMHRGRVSSKEKMQVRTIPLTRAQVSLIQLLLYQESYMARVTPYPMTNAAHVMTMYSNNVSTSYVIHREDGEDVQTLSFPMIEN